MTAKRKITDNNGVQVFPITHTKAVLDDNGNSVEQRLQENLDLINQKQLEVGAVPSDVTPTAGSTNWVTSGGVYECVRNLNGINNADFLKFTQKKAIATLRVGDTCTFETVDNAQLSCTVIHLQDGESCSFANSDTSSFRLMIVQANGKVKYVATTARTGLYYYTAAEEVSIVVNSLVEFNNTFATKSIFLPAVPVDITNVFNKVIGCNAVQWKAGTVYLEAICSNIIRFSEQYYCAIVPCSEGEKFTVKLSAPASGIIRSFAFYDNTDNRLNISAQGNYEGIITAPENAAYAVFNSFKDINPYVFVGELSSQSIFDTFVNLNINLDKLADAIGEETVEVPITKTNGFYWNSQGEIAIRTAYSGYSLYEPISIDHQYEYSIYIYKASSTKQHAVILVDENYTILKRYSAPVGFNTFTVSPADAADAKYILLTTNTGSSNPTSVTFKKPYQLSEINDKVKRLTAGTLDFKDKNIAIIGDSISTNGHYDVTNPLGNVPEIIVQTEDIGVELSAYVTYYDIGVTIGGHTITSEDVGTELTFTPVSGDEGKIIGKPNNNNPASTVVWWEVAMNALGFNPIPVSWSGSSITSHEGNTEAMMTSYAWHPAQIRKCGIRIPGTMTRTAPDMIIIYRGTNDFSHSPYTRLTDFLNVYPVSIPESDTFDDDGTTRYGYLEGLAITVNKLREAYPEAQIVVCTFNYFHRVSSGQPSRNGINTIYQYNDAIRAFANYFGCGLIEFDKDGITYANAASGAYYNEGTSPTANHTHPNTKGHKVMGNRAIIDLQKINSTD